MKPKKFSFLIIVLITLGLATLLVVGVIFLAVRAPQWQQFQLRRTGPEGQETPALNSSEAPTTIVYGLWTEENSKIFAVNSDGSNHLLLASFPKNIKDVHVLSKNELLYLADVDARDHGHNLKIYNLITGVDRTIYTSPFGYGIDDIVLSADKSKVATWEVQFKPGSNVLAEGTSQVRVVNLKTKEDNTIVPAQKAGPDNPTHYPRFFNHTATTLYTDLFAANGGGVGFGLTAWDLNTKKGSEVTWLSEGEYAHDFSLHPEKDLLIYRTHVENDKSIFLAPPEGMTYLEAEQSPNALASLNLVSGEKQIIPVSGTGLLQGVSVVSPNGDLVATWEYHLPISQEGQEGGSLILLFDLKQQNLQSLGKKISLDEESPVPLAWLDNTTLLVNLDIPHQAQFMGNLGENYHTLVRKFATMDLEGTITPLLPELSDPQNAQFIEVVAKPKDSPTFFSGKTLKATKPQISRLVDRVELTFRIAQQWGPPSSEQAPPSGPVPPIPTPEPEVKGAKTSHGLVLGTTTSAAPQCLMPPGCYGYCEADGECVSGNCVPSYIPGNDPWCQHLASQSSCWGCEAPNVSCTPWHEIPGGLERTCTVTKQCYRPKSCYTGCICQNNRCVNPKNPENENCMTLKCETYTTTETYPETQSFTYGCPLYLYPEKPIRIGIYLPIKPVWSKPVYQNGWYLTAYPDGNLVMADGSQAPYLAYSAHKDLPSPPSTAILMGRESLESDLEQYATRLGLNQQETNDFVTFWLKKLPIAPYYQVSHYPWQQAQEIAALQIKPQPDVFHAIVMYFKPLDKPVKLAPPVFEKVPDRNGFFALDWGGVIEPN